MAAEEIKAILSGRDKIEQERIMRWVGESLGVAAVPAPLPPFVKPPDASSTVGPATAQPAAPGSRKPDVKAFVTSKSPKSDNQVAAVIAYFFRFEAPEADRKEFVTPADLQNASRQARGYGFNDPLKTLNNAVAQGYFDRKDRGVFNLNAVGENLVAMALPSNGAQNGGHFARKPARAKARSAAKPKKG